MVSKIRSPSLKPPSPTAGAFLLAASVGGLFLFYHSRDVDQLGLWRAGQVADRWLLIELVPTAVTFAFLVNPNNSTTPARTEIVQSVARASDRQFAVLNVGGEGDFDTAFATLAQ